MALLPRRRRYDAKYHAEEMRERKRIVLIAHDNKKAELMAWCKRHRNVLAGHDLLATGTTGTLLAKALRLPIEKLASGPLGGDQQVGARITEAKIDVMIFFWDPLEAQSHDPDVKALLRIAAVWNVPVASNLASADFLVTSPLLGRRYVRQVPAYIAHAEK